MWKIWEYPRNIGIIIAGTESGGYDIIYLDYRECGKDGEFKVSVCFQEYDYEIQVLANKFEEFIGMLISEEDLE
ncbi:SMI1/KNR4 family protein [Granulicatella elegans]|uniref:SMI1/KNR4 family protein n=1 Tax=Granulicatella elegans TaxID=137732 RepID=UPI003A102428